METKQDAAVKERDAERRSQDDYPRDERDGRSGDRREADRRANRQSPGETQIYNEARDNWGVIVEGVIVRETRNHDPDLSDYGDPHLPPDMLERPPPPQQSVAGYKEREKAAQEAAKLEAELTRASDASRLSQQAQRVEEHRERGMTQAAGGQQQPPRQAAERK